MEMEAMSEFVVDTKGHCFLCLSQINSHSVPGKLSAEPSLSSSPVYSIHSLFHYLKLDIRQVGNDKGKIIPPNLLAQLEGSRLKVELCEDCASLNNKFLELSQQLEKIKAAVASHLNLIHDKLLDAEAEKTEGFRKLAEWQVDDASGGLMRFRTLELVEALRSQAFQKCSRRLRIDPFRAQPQEQEILPGSSSPDEGILNETQSEGIVVKLDPGLTSLIKHDVNEGWDDSELPELPSEISTHMPSSPTEYDTVMRTVKTETNEQEEEGRNEEVALGDEEMQQSTTSSDEVGIPLLFENINPETGQFKCVLCSKEFPCPQEVQQHYQSYHLNMHNCTLCGKECRSRRQFKEHHQSFHMGIRYHCSICNKAFPRKDALKVHMEGNHFGQRFECPRCLKAFSYPGARNRHMKLVNCGVKTSLAGNVNFTHLASTPSTSSSSSLLPSPSKTQPKSYPCDLCFKTFLSTSSRSEHKQVYHNGQKLQCEFCHAEFRHRSSKSTHKRTCAKRPQQFKLEDPLMVDLN